MRQVKRAPVTQPTDPAYRAIPLTRGQVAIVDAKNYDWLMQWKWFAWRDTSLSFYAVRNASVAERATGSGFRVWMHRVIMNAPFDREVDHIDGDGLHDWEKNLRLVIRRENACNRKAQANNGCKLKGVSVARQVVGSGRYRAKIALGGKQHHLGYFDTAEEASAAYVDAAKRLHGEYAKW